MPPTCKICTHKKRKAIEERLLKGESARAIARQYGVSDMTVGRHKKNCMSRDAVAGIQKAKRIASSEKKIKKENREKAKKATKEIKRQEDAGFFLMDKIADLEAETREIVDEAKSTKKLTVALQGIDKLAKLQELYIKFAAEAREQERARKERESTDQDVVIEIMVEILQQYPEVYEEFANECSRRKITSG